MFPKKIAIFIFCFICDSSFAQDSVFHIRKKLQEKHVFNQNQEALITDLVSRDETAYHEANFDFYGDFLSRKLHSYGDVDLRFGGKCLQDLLIVLQDMAVGERYALMSKSFLSSSLDTKVIISSIIFYLFITFFLQCSIQEESYPLVWLTTTQGGSVSMTSAHKQKK